MNKRLLRCVVAVLGLALLGPLGGCGGDDTCEDACSKIYSQCGLEITGLTQGDCVTQCKAEGSTQEDIKCVMDAACDAAAIGACI